MCDGLLNCRRLRLRPLLFERGNGNLLPRHGIRVASQELVQRPALISQPIQQASEFPILELQLLKRDAMFDIPLLRLGIADGYLLLQFLDVLLLPCAALALVIPHSGETVESLLTIIREYRVNWGHQSLYFVIVFATHAAAAQYAIERDRYSSVLTVSRDQTREVAGQTDFTAAGI